LTFAQGEGSTCPLMSIAYRIDREKGITFVRFHGVVTADEFLAHVRRLTADPDWPPPPRRLQLADLCGASLHASLDDAAMEEAVDLFAAHASRIAGAKAAVVATDAFARVLDFAHLLLHYLPSTIVFHDLSTACGWLGIDQHAAQTTLGELRPQG
jgi:hypothetical protein